MLVLLLMVVISAGGTEYLVYQHYIDQLYIVVCLLLFWGPSNIQGHGRTGTDL